MDTDSNKRRFLRSQFAVVLVLTPLNGTFERKCLVVPFAPDVLKLGRQTTSRTQAAPDNGYFDSRVLSRQHAEIWADYDTGKVWLHDSKSSNGTYINNKRLSAENTESEPFELRSGDHLDLGIDIMCNDETKQMYKKISAKVEKVSMLPLHVGLQQRQQQRQERLASENSGGNPSKLPTLSRSPSIETLRTVRGTNGMINTNGSEAIFGGTNSIETMALNHANTTAGGQLVKDTVKTHVNFELAAKRLVAQIRAVRADTAKIQSVASMLENIKRAALEAEEKDKLEFQKLENERRELMKLRQDGRNIAKSSSLAALKAENTRMRAELSHLSKSRNTSPSHHSANNIVVPSSPTASSPSSSTSSAVNSPNGDLPITRKRGLSVTMGQHSSSHRADHNHSRAVRSPIVETPKESIMVPKRVHIHPPDSKIVWHNIMVLIGTAVLVTLTGVWIMFFFNPPMAPQSHSPLLFFKPIQVNHSNTIE